MDIDLKNNFEFMTSVEIAKALAKRIQTIRKKKFKTQKEFAEHIGMSYGTYARFEKTGQVSFVGFLEIIKGLDLIEQAIPLFEEEKQLIEW